MRESASPESWWQPSSFKNQQPVDFLHAVPALRQRRLAGEDTHDEEEIDYKQHFVCLENPLRCDFLAANTR